MEFTLNVEQTKDFLFKPTIMHVEAREVNEHAMAVDENGAYMWDENGNAILEIMRDENGVPVLNEEGKYQLSGRMEDVVYANIKLTQQVNPFKRIVEDNSLRLPAHVFQLVTGFEKDGKTPIYNQEGMAALLGAFNLKTA